MKETEYFLDSYAVIEILKSNPNYEEFSEITPVSTRINLVEVAYRLLDSFSEEKVVKILGSMKIKCLEIEESHVSKIAVFRKNNSKKRLSYIDCIGYALAKENNLKFLTGDKEFKNMPNVEFVK
ncbi:PIN domain-containing protein [Candidatus Micrarchaeota archaeon]|nr:PIN domain-containing protein [Candidatus Micrarchaeota archaeon]MBU2476651.1 PIN domain-containing protein [Candidatus Micrarchaeota archaeon]